MTAESRVARRVRALRTIRDENLRYSVEYREVAQYLMQAKASRWRCLQKVESLNDEKSHRAVWVPPSSSRASRHGLKGSVEDLDAQIRKAKGEAKLHGTEVRRLSLKKAFLVWRATSATSSQMEQKLEDMDGEDTAAALEKAFAAWSNVAEPWA